MKLKILKEISESVKYEIQSVLIIKELVDNIFAICDLFIGNYTIGNIFKLYKFIVFLRVVIVKMDQFFKDLKNCDYNNEIYDMIEYDLPKSIKEVDNQGNTMLHQCVKHFKQDYDFYSQERTIGGVWVGSWGYRIINRMVSYGVDINTKNNKNMTPMQLDSTVANIFNQFIGIENRYLIRNINDNNEFESIRTSIDSATEIAFYACKHGNIKYLSFIFKYISPSILSKEYNEFVKLESGYSLLHIAIINKQMEIIDYLLRIGVNTCQCDPYGRTPIYLALKFINITSIWDSIWKSSEMYHIPSAINGNTILQDCIRNSKIDAIEWILNNVPNVGLNGSECIFKLAEGKKEILDTLIEYIKFKFY